MSERARDRDTAEPIEEAHRARMNQIAANLTLAFPGMGFCLLVFPFGDNDGRMNYISNSERSDMIVALEEFIAKNRLHAAPITGKPS